ncbi:MAG: tetratricopeptide repeat protein [Planctomycetota bacterium]
MPRTLTIPTKLRVPLGLVLLWLLTSLPFVRSFGVPFIFDDLTIVGNNQFMRSLWPIGAAMEAPNRSTAAGRPLVTYTFAINYAISGTRVWSYHALNLAVHLINASLVWYLVSRLLGVARVPGVPRRLFGPIGWGFALLWGVHALNSETVIYIAQRTESMFAMFSLMAVALLLAGTTNEQKDGTTEASAEKKENSSLALQLGVTILIVFAVLCKEAAVVMPPLILLLDRAFIAGSFREALARRRWMYLGLLLPVLVGISIARGDHRGGLVTDDASVTWRYLLTQAGVILFYLRLSLVPYPLAVTHDWPLVDGLRDSLPSSAVVLGMVLFMFYALWRHPRVGFLLAWFFFILAPTSTVIPIMSEVVGERRMYLPLLSVLAVVLWGLWSALRWLSRRGVVAGRPAVLRGWLGGGIAVAAVALGVMTYVRSLDYQDKLTLWEQTVRVEPGSLMALNNYAAALIETNRYEQAEGLLRRVLAENPSHPRSHHGLGLIYFHRKQWDRAADAFLTEAMKADGAATDYAHAAVSLMMQDKMKPAERAIQEALRMNPRDPQTLNFAAVMLDRQGRSEEAIEAYRHLIDLYPETAMGRANLAAALDKLGRLDEAETAYREAYEIFPTSFDIVNNYANFLAKRDRYAEAAELFRAASALYPTAADPRLKWAVCLERSDDPATEDAYSEVLMLHPDHLQGYLRYAEWLEEQDRLASAENVVRDGLAVFPEQIDLLELRDRLKAELEAQATPPEPSESAGP